MGNDDAAHRAPDVELRASSGVSEIIGGPGARLTRVISAKTPLTLIALFAIMIKRVFEGGMVHHGVNRQVSRR